MATSTKVKFDLATLRRLAVASLDERIRVTQLEVDSFDDEEALAERIKEWRVRQEDRISDLFRSLGEGGIGDYQLAKWQVDPIPSVDRWDRRDAQNRLARLKADRTRVVAKSEAVVADEDGNISLTTTQMAEYFGI